jgi:hypothetical protein
MLISEAVLDACSEFRTSLGVSIDGPEGVQGQRGFMIVIVSTTPGKEPTTRFWKE